MQRTKLEKLTKVFITLTEEEAGKLKTVLLEHVSWLDERWAEEIYEELEGEGVDDRPYVSVGG